MINVSEAVEIIDGVKLNTKAKEICIADAVGAILREPLSLDRDLPPFDRVMMDGIAIQFDQWGRGRSVFPVEGLQQAGGPKQIMKDSEHCMEVMTGAVLPGNTDTVVRYEDIDMRQQGGEAVAVMQKGPKAKGQNIHPKGTNRKKGELVVGQGTVLSPAEIGIAATVGKTELKVAEAPNVAVISTGDELVEISQRPLPHQIRQSNAYTLSAALGALPIKAEMFHLNDDRLEIAAKLDDVLEQFDVVVLSGGVSRGKLDYIPELLEQKGIRKLFHKVRQRPGKPFWFGRGSGGVVVFALPGNPVSTLACYYRYIKPWIQKQMRIPDGKVPVARLTEDYTFGKAFTYFLQVKAGVNTEGILEAKPIKGKGSSDLANLCRADGFLELPENRNHFKAGESYPLYLYRSV